MAEKAKLTNKEKIEKAIKFAETQIAREQSTAEKAKARYWKRLIKILQ